MKSIGLAAAAAFFILTAGAVSVSGTHGLENAILAIEDGMPDFAKDKSGVLDVLRGLLDSEDVQHPEVPADGPPDEIPGPPDEIAGPPGEVPDVPPEVPPEEAEIPDGLPEESDEGIGTANDALDQLPFRDSA